MPPARVEDAISALTALGYDPEVVYENGSPVLMRVPLRNAALQHGTGHGGGEAARPPSAAAGPSAAVGPGAGQPPRPPPFERLPERIRCRVQCLCMAPHSPPAEDRLCRAFWLGGMDAGCALDDRTDLVDLPMPLPHDKWWVVLRPAARYGGLGPSVVTASAHRKALVTDGDGANDPSAISRGFNSVLEVEAYLAGAGQPPELAAPKRRWRPPSGYYVY